MGGEMGKVKKVVLAYSGGLDTSVIIPWLRENYGCEVVAMTADLGQGEDMDALREKALRSGASKVYVEDLRREFVEEFAFRVLRAGAVYEGGYLLGTAFARPLIARRQVEIAEAEGADAVAHGATGKGNDQVRFELTYKALAPELKVIAPWREWEMSSREEELKYARERGIPVPVDEEKIYSRDRNLWHLSHEAGPLEDPWTTPPEDVYQLTSDPRDAPDEPEYLEIEFERGRPVGVDGRKLAPVELLEHLNEVASKHGVGRTDMVENRLVGIKCRGVYETPGGTLLYIAHEDLERFVLDRDTYHYKQLVALRYAELVYYGQWFSPLREALDAFVERTQEPVTGTVRLMLYKGSCRPVGRKSPYSIYSKDLATFGRGIGYDHRDAGGFIKLFGLQQELWGRVRRG